MSQFQLFKKRPPRTYLFITVDDILLLEPSITNKGSAYRKIKDIREACDKNAKAAITVSTYCEYRGLNEAETLEIKKQLGFKIDTDD